MSTDATNPPSEVPATFELQAAIVAAARASGHAGARRRAGSAQLVGHDPARRRSSSSASWPSPRLQPPARTTLWGQAPPTDGIAGRLHAALDADDVRRARRSSPRPSRYGVDELGFEPDAWVGELVRAVLGAGYPSRRACSPTSSRCSSATS